MALVKPESLAFEPGTKWSYSNTGKLVLGKLIEVASRQDYFAYVREHVYSPARMTDSDALELDRVNYNLAVGYEREETPTAWSTVTTSSCRSSAAGRRAAATPLSTT